MDGSLLPALFPLFVFVVGGLIARRSFPYFCWRNTFLFSSLVWGLLVTVMTESLSAFKQIRFGSVLSGWIFVLLVFSGYFLRIIRKDRWTGEQQKRRGLSLFDWFLLIYIALMITLVGFVAWISPPNNWDSMTYHMSRVMHWIQNQSVAHYPTHILRQLHMTPWSEYAILHF